MTDHTHPFQNLKELEESELGQRNPDLLQIISTSYKTALELGNDDIAMSLLILALYRQSKINLN